MIRFTRHWEFTPLRYSGFVPVYYYRDYCKVISERLWCGVTNKILLEHLRLRRRLGKWRLQQSAAFITSRKRRKKTAQSYYNKRAYVTSRVCLYRVITLYHEPVDISESVNIFFGIYLLCEFIIRNKPR